MPDGGRVEVPLNLGKLHPKQRIAFWSLATELFYGGAKGGAKSHLMRVASIIWCSEIPGLQVYLFRRLREDLQKNHMEGPKGYRAMLAPWVRAKLVEIIEDEIRFWNGARIYLCHCKDPAHVYKYFGAEMHVLLIDELTQWLLDMYLLLRTSVRAPGLVIPDAVKDRYRGLFPRILATSNPGNIGHNWVKAMFVSPRLPYTIERMPPADGGMLRQYVPALLEDNPTMAEDDPTYVDRLEGLGSKELVRAYKEGDWDIIAGAYFDNVSRALHELPPFTPPKHWTRFRAFDWGSKKPFSVGWYAIAEAELVKFSDGSERQLPPGALVRYREWYGIETDKDGVYKPDSGVKLDVEVVADGILRREYDAGEKMEDRFNRADPSMWAESGGPSLIERMWSYRPKWQKKGEERQCIFHQADHERVTGWLQMRTRFNIDPDHNAPMHYVTRDCLHWWRTVPVLQHDPVKVEDIDTKSEDHVGDENRYACMARPISINKPPAAPEGPAPWTFDWIVKKDEEAKRRQQR